MFGVAGQYAFKTKGANSLYSSINGSLTYTTKNQLIFQLKNNAYILNNKYFLSGDWRFLIFSQATYGLGTNAPEDGILKYQFGINGIEVNDDSLIQPMKYNQVRFHQTISRNVGKKVYLGFGYHLDYYYSIQDEKLDTLAPGVLITSHYAYSIKYGFNPKQYVRSGISLNMVMDTRDNMINSYKGYFLNVNYRLDPEFLGSDRSGNMLSVEWRSFHPFSKMNPRHSLAFWFLGNLSPVGDMPYLALPALGYDQRGRSGRGYTQGRYRGPNYLYAESEYRFPISQCGGILGGVIFVNANTADKPDRSVRLFDYVVPGYGFGLRMMVDKHSRTNLQVDFGFGKKSGGVYFGAAETF
jgi:outer membrane protein assembly factor BamA